MQVTIADMSDWAGFMYIMNTWYAMMYELLTDDGCLELFEENIQFL